MTVHVIPRENVTPLLRALSGRTEADDLRRELVAMEVQNVQHTRALLTIEAEAIWWQVVLAAAVERNEARGVRIRAELDAMGEPHEKPADVAAKRSAGLLPRLSINELAEATHRALGGRP